MKKVLFARRQMRRQAKKVESSGALSKQQEHL
jgi:hypothetical protein